MAANVVLKMEAARALQARTAIYIWGCLNNWLERTRSEVRISMRSVFYILSHPPSHAQRKMVYALVGWTTFDLFMRGPLECVKFSM